MYLTHFESSHTARLSQILRTLEDVHGVKINIDVTSPHAEGKLLECQRSYENKRANIVKESSFNSYQQNPEYIKSMLILEAVRIMLTEIGPKRSRRRGVAESNIEIESAIMKAHAYATSPGMNNVHETDAHPDDEDNSDPEPDANDPWNQYKKKHVQGLYNYRHYEHPDGSFMQFRNGPEFQAIHQDPAGNRKTFTNRREIDAMKNHVRQSHARDTAVEENKINKETIVAEDEMMIKPQAAIEHGTVGRSHHYEYQASMARSELYRNARYAMSMMKQVDVGGEVQPWIAGSLTKAANYLDKIFHYLDYYTKFEPEHLPEDMEPEMELGQTSGSISRQNLFMIIEYSTKLFEMIKPGDRLEGWVAMKLTTASECVSSCKHYMDYVQFEKHALDDHFSEGKRAMRKSVNEAAWQSDLDEKNSVTVQGYAGLKSKPFTRKFPNKAAADKWMEKNAENIKVTRVVNESISMLSEDENLAKAQTVLAAKEMVNKLQDMAEDVAKLSVEDLMPLIDMMRDQFGHEAADGFNQSAKTSLEELLRVTQSTKDTLDAAVDTLNGGGIPAEKTDIEQFGSDQPPAGDMAATDIDKDIAAQGPAQGNSKAPVVPSEPLGRAKKDDIAEGKNGKIPPQFLKNIKKKKDKEGKGTDKKSSSNPFANKTNEAYMPGTQPPPMAKNPLNSPGSNSADLYSTMDDAGVDKLSQSGDAKAKAELKKRQTAAATTTVIPAGGTPMLPAKTITNSSFGESNSNARPAKKLPENQINEVAPPGKKASDFIEKNTAKFKSQYGKKWRERLYATAWKNFGPKSESFNKAAAVVETSKSRLANLDSQMANHRKIFSKMISEGRATDPLNVGYI